MEVLLSWPSLFLGVLAAVLMPCLLWGAAQWWLIYHGPGWLANLIRAWEAINPLT